MLGGSTPFTASLIDAMKAMGERLPAHELVLYGRNGVNLQLVERYARQQLEDSEWHVQSTMQIEQALTGATLVVHQIRYHGMERWMACEEFCARNGVGADETLGPGALLCAMLSVPGIRATCLALRRYCPDAWVLNLTSPLSSVTVLMLGAGVSRCFGLCELPWVTVQEAGRVLDIPASELEWSYRGLNHRGFIYQLTYHGRDLLVELSRCLGDRSVLGMGGDDRPPGSHPAEILSAGEASWACGNRACRIPYQSP